MNKYYLRIENKEFGFVVDGIHEIKEIDVEITNEDYDKFFELQSEGKQFRVKSIPNRNLGLFGYVEEFIPPVDTTPQPPSLAERISAIENMILQMVQGSL